jgi:hypothetical protein
LAGRLASPDAVGKMSLEAGGELAKIMEIRRQKNGSRQ